VLPGSSESMDGGSAGAILLGRGVSLRSVRSDGSFTSSMGGGRGGQQLLTRGDSTAPSVAVESSDHGFGSNPAVVIGTPAEGGQQA